MYVSSGTLFDFILQLYTAFIPYTIDLSVVYILCVCAQYVVRDAIRRAVSHCQVRGGEAGGGAADEIASGDGDGGPRER